MPSTDRELYERFFELWMNAARLDPADDLSPLQNWFSTYEKNYQGQKKTALDLVEAYFTNRGPFGDDVLPVLIRALPPRAAHDWLLDRVQQQYNLDRERAGSLAEERLSNRLKALQPTPYFHLLARSRTRDRRPSKTEVLWVFCGHAFLHPAVAPMSLVKWLAKSLHARSAKAPDDNLSHPF